MRALSPKQREAARLWVRGHTAAGIAGVLGVEVGTVRGWMRLKGMRALLRLLAGTGITYRGDGMSAVAERVNDRHRRVVMLRIEGRSCGEIAREMGYSSPQAVSNVLGLAHVRAYHERMRSRLEDSLTNATRYLLSDVVELVAVPLRRASA